MKKAILILSVLAFIASGCKKTTKQETSEAELPETENSEVVEMPSQCYVGVWHNAPNSPNELTIFEIGEDIIKFELIHFASLPTNGTAKIENNQIVFATDDGEYGIMHFNDGYIMLEINDWDYHFPIQVAQKPFERKLQYCYYSNYTLYFYDDGTVYDTSMQNTKKYKKTETGLSFGGGTWEFFDDFGRIREGWKIINYHKVNSPLQITNVEKDIKKISKSNIQNITETCLILITPEQSKDANEEYDPVMEWSLYAYDRAEQYEAMGIKSVYAKKKYLSFALADGEKVVIDTKKAQNDKFPPTILLYKKGKIPIELSPSGESDEGNELIEEYLRESGDGMP